MNSIITALKNSKWNSRKLFAWIVTIIPVLFQMFTVSNGTQQAAYGIGAGILTAIYTLAQSLETAMSTKSSTTVTPVTSDQILALEKQLQITMSKIASIKTAATAAPAATAETAATVSK